MADRNGDAQIEGSNGLFWITKKGWDPDHNRIYHYEDSGQQFYFSVEMVPTGIGNGPNYTVTHADRGRQYRGATVALGNDKKRIVENIQYFLETRIIHFPDQLITDPRDIPSSISFSWDVR